MYNGTTPPLLLATSDYSYTPYPLLSPASHKKVKKKKKRKTINESLFKRGKTAIVLQVISVGRYVGTRKKDFFP